MKTILENKISGKHILFYLIWTILFTIIPIMVNRPENLIWEMLLVAIISSAILSVPATYFFFRILNKQIHNRETASFDYLFDEEIIMKINANLKRDGILLDGILFLTEKRILFIGTEFFDQNKVLIDLLFNMIVKYEYIDNSRLIIRDNLGKKHVLVLNSGSGFLEKLSDIIS